MNKGKHFSSPKKIALTIANLFILAIACAIVCSNPYCATFVLTVIQCGLGLYVSGKSIHESSSTASWTCADNGQ